MNLRCKTLQGSEGTASPINHPQKYKELPSLVCILTSFHAIYVSIAACLSPITNLEGTTHTTVTSGLQFCAHPLNQILCAIA